MADNSYRQHLDSLPKKRLSAYQEWRQSGAALPMPLGFLLLAVGTVFVGLLFTIPLAILMFGMMISPGATFIALATGLLIFTIYTKGYESRFEQIVYVSMSGTLLAFAMVVTVLVSLLEGSIA